MVSGKHPFSGFEIYERFQTLLSGFDERLIGQQAAKGKLAIHVAEFEADIARTPGTPRVLLLAGPTGSGKTELCRALAEMLNLPIAYVNAPELSHTSFMGQQITSVVASLLRNDDESMDEDAEPQEQLLRLMRQAIKNKSDANTPQRVRGIVVVDEIDKITFLPEEMRQGSQAQERHNLAVQSMLLPLFEGGRMRSSANLPGKQSVDLDTSAVLVIASGAFEDQRFKNAVRRRDESAVSFKHGHWKSLHHGDLISFGLMEELVGRIRTIIVLDRWMEADTRKLVRRFLEQGDWSLFGYRIDMDDSVLDIVSERANDMRLGARGAWILFETIKHHVFLGASGIEVNHKTHTIHLTNDYARANWS